MAFHIQKTVGNGYRCSCCAWDYESDEWEETQDVALQAVPVELVEEEPHPFNGDLEILSVEVVDGSTGKAIASGRLRWPVGFGKSANYSYCCWSGFRPDTGAFEVVYKGREKTDRAWKDVLAEFSEKHREAQLREARLELEEAQQKIQRLS